MKDHKMILKALRFMNLLSKLGLRLSMSLRKR